jgi:excisionase family DNA binding protein
MTHTDPASSPSQMLLLTAKQAAKMLSISERMLWTLTDTGEIQCVRIRRAVRYAFGDLQKYVESHRS